jgi:hypothetical protein
VRLGLYGAGIDSFTGFSGWQRALLIYQITDPDNWATDRAAITTWLADRYGVTL